MTALEIILIVILWVGYGAFATYQTKDLDLDEENVFVWFFIYIIFSPIVFVVKALYGAFKKYR